MQARLVAQARSGDRDAFEAIVADATDRLHAVAVLVLRDRGAAEDAVQEALLKAWRDLPGLRDPDRFDAWLRRLLINACHDEQRRRRRQPQTELLPAHHGSTADSSGAFLDRDRIGRAFARLPVPQRAAVVLYHYLDLPLTDVADALGTSTGTTKSRLFQARRAMRAALDADDRTPHPTKGRTA
jgi:RNA polymerase sigma-70 factor (ECF subfamily)